jgi:GH25 family lysozyme M1 (1,4-beta-N-acetylmuramidase)
MLQLAKAIDYNRAHWPDPSDLPEAFRSLDPASTTAADAVALWQREHGLTIDGCLGPKTLASMRGSWVLGVDVSAWQSKPIDWAKARDAGIRYAFIKATEDEGYTSKAFQTQARGAMAAGLLVSPYHFAGPEADDSPSREADRLCDVYGAAPYQLRPVLDLEKANKLPAEAVAKWAASFVARVRQRLGFLPIFYSYASFVAERRKAWALYPWLVECPLWIARYSPYPPKSVAPWPHWHVWQYTQRGVVPGIAGKVDLNRCTEADLASLRRPAEEVVSA